MLETAKKTENTLYKEFDFWGGGGGWADWVFLRGLTHYFESKKFRIDLLSCKQSKKRCLTMFKTAKIAEKTIYKEFRIHHDFDSHRSLRYINIIPIILYKY